MRRLELQFVKLVALAMAAAMLVPPCASAQGANDTGLQVPPRRAGRILGVFDENGRPLEGADVLDRIGGGSLRTTRSGLVGMANVTSQHDSAVVTIRKIGFADTTVLIMVGARDTVPVQIFLRHATALEGVTITAREIEHLPFYLKDFAERLEAAKGTGAKAFTPEDFRKKDGRHLYDVLREKHVGDRSARCGRILVYLDGVPRTPPKTENFTAGVPEENADAFDAAIFYTVAEMPADLLHTMAPGSSLNAVPCGALLLYSRHNM